MTRSVWIDAVLGVLGVAFTATVGVISAHVSPAYRHPLYGLCVALAAVTLAQTVRAIRRGLHHERAFAELREGQEYLAQPESHRQMEMIWQQQVGLTIAEDLFQQHFEIDSRDAAATRVRCKICDWHTEKALVDARQDAVQHYRAFHERPERTGSRWRRMLRV